MDNGLRKILNQIFKLNNENVVGPPNFLAQRQLKKRKKKKTKRKKEKENKKKKLKI